MKTMIAFRIEDSTRNLIDDLQRRGNFRSQADLIQAALEALDAKLNETAAIDDDNLLARLTAIEARLAAIESGRTALAGAAIESPKRHRVQFTEPMKKRITALHKAGSSGGEIKQTIEEEFHVSLPDSFLTNVGKYLHE